MVGGNLEQLEQLIQKTFTSATEQEVGQETIRRINTIIEIKPNEKDPIYVVVQDGKFKIEKVRPKTNDPNGIVPIESSEETLREIFSGNLKFTDAAFDRNDLIAPLYGQLSYITAWLAKIIRIGNRKPLFPHKY